MVSSNGLIRLLREIRAQTRHPNKRRSPILGFVHCSRATTAFLHTDQVPSQRRRSPINFPRTRAAVPALFVLLLGLNSCGGGSSSPPLKPSSQKPNSSSPPLNSSSPSLNSSSPSLKPSYALG